MKKRIPALLATGALMASLLGGALSSAALWVKTPIMAGDMNGDGKPDTGDALLALQYAAKIIEEDVLDMNAGDVNDDGRVDTGDALLLLQKAAKIIDEFPCAEKYALKSSGAETTPNENPEEWADYTSQNPIITTMYTADPSAHVWKDGRIYLYPSQDIAPPKGCDRMNKYHVFSSDNMVDWIDHGQIMESSDVMWSNCDGFMWAPDCCYIEKTDTYYYFFPHPITNDAVKVHGDQAVNAGDSWGYTWVMGVAKSVGSPTGPFEQLGYVKLADELTGNLEKMLADRSAQDLGRGAGCFDSSRYASLKAYDGKTLGDYGVSGWAVGGWALIDPCAFVDDDGKVYLYYGGGSTCYVVELGEDMLTATTLPKQIRLNNFHEGMWVFKNPDNGFYYAMYADNGTGGDQQMYATSYSPTGPFSDNGVLLTSTGCGTSHGSVAQYKGNWYLFYHNAALSGGVNELRSVCVDQMQMDENGFFAPVKQTKTGVKAVGKPVPKSDNSARLDESDFTITTKYDLSHATADGGASIAGEGDSAYVQNMHNHGSTCTFSGINGGKGGKALVKVEYGAAMAAGATIHTPADTTGEGYYISFPSTNGYGNYQFKASCVVELKEGENAIVLEGGHGGFNIKSISVSLLPANAE